MKIENQVTSLELSKKLKELGFNKNLDSLFIWERDHKGKFGIVTKEDFMSDHLKNNYRTPEDLFCSAYTVAELGEMLPNSIQCKKETDSWYCIWEDVEVCPVAYKKLHGQKYHRDEWAKTEADARAKMLIYLKENNLI